jgi:hypothetical protein
MVRGWCGVFRSATASNEPRHFTHRENGNKSARHFTHRTPKTVDGHVISPTFSVDKYVISPTGLSSFHPPGSFSKPCPIRISSVFHNP